MANLKEIRTRIKSVQSTQQITSAMKMVSAAKLRRAQDAIVQMRPYANKLQEILGNLSSSLDTSENVYARESELKKVLLVAISSNRGLAGAFNANIIKAAIRWSQENPGVEYKVLAIGKKSNDYFKKQENTINADLKANTVDIFENLNFSFVSEIAQEVMDEFASGKYDQVHLIYNSFKNAATQIVKTEQFLPILPPEVDPEDTQNTSLDYIFEPNKEEIVKDMIPKSLKVQLYKAILDSYAAEHGARMTAMHKATDNAGEILRDLKLTYNKARQAAITGEILEIVAGAEALN
ncbi:MAG: ATP synthase F1 subunit gamma [Flavobacteriales bacterium]|nr:ATP synthase F1 subunit gamma [Flavobacteriales bacterium]